MYLYENGRLVGRYTVATGKEVSLTPEGDLVIVVKEASDQGLGQDRIFGTRWLGLKTCGRNQRKHALNEPGSIGEHASAGCVRMSQADLEEVYARVPLGTLVRIQRGWAWHRHLVMWFSK